MVFANICLNVSNLSLVCPLTSVLPFWTSALHIYLDIICWALWPLSFILKVKPEAHPIQIDGNMLRLRDVPFSFEELSERGRRVLGFVCATEGKSLSETPTWIRHLESSSDSLFWAPSMWETGLNDALTHAGTGRSLTRSRLCTLHLYLAFCAPAAGLDADRWTDKNKQTKFCWEMRGILLWFGGVWEAACGVWCS